MSRPKKIEIGILNITTHPHPDGVYATLLRQAKAKRIAVPFYGSRHAMIASFAEVRNKPSDFNSRTVHGGTINCYTDFDTSKPWLNLARGDVAEPDELKAVVLPKDLRPEYESFRFLFFADVHRLVFERTIGPSGVRRLFFGLLNAVSEHEVEVMIEQDKEGLDAILQIFRLDTLTIQVMRPNADDFGRFDKEIEERLKNQRAAHVRLELKASRGGSGLAPDETTIETAKVALSNGNVVGKGVDASGVPVMKSTDEHPLMDVSTQEESVTNATLFEGARRLFARIFRRGD